MNGWSFANVLINNDLDMIESVLSIETVTLDLINNYLIFNIIIIVIIIIQHLYSALKSEDAEALVASGYNCLNK